MKIFSKIPKKWQIPIVGLVVLLILAGAGWTIWSQQSQPVQTTEQINGYTTTRVSMGDLVLTTSGTGTLAAASEVDLSFAASGTVAQLNVQVGDKVTSGQVLASLAEIDELKLALETAQLDEKSAQKTLTELLNSSPVQLADALSAQAAAQETLSQATYDLHTRDELRCPENVWGKYYDAYVKAQHNLESMEIYIPETPVDENLAAYNSLMIKLKRLRDTRNEAYGNLTYCAGYTEQEVLESEANLQLAQANAALAEKTYQVLLTNSGIDPEELAIAQAAVDNAALQVKKAQTNLDGAVLTAPIDGTVTAVNVVQGESSGTNTAITIADLQDLKMDVHVDEVDVLSFNEGCAAEITFDAVPDKVYSGVVTQVSPVLLAVREVDVAEGTVRLDSTKLNPEKTLPLGLSGAVDITCDQAQGVMLVPVDAVHESMTEPAYVYILNDLGEPEKTTVTLGLRNSTSVEVVSGLNMGDIVITSAVDQN